MEENYKNYQIYGDSGKNSTKEQENEVIVENNIENKSEEPKIDEKETPYWEKDDFDWNNKNMWINNPLAVKYWMNNGNSIHKYNKLYREHLNEMEQINTDNIKTY